MTPDGALRLLDLYARAQEAIDGDRIAEAQALLADAEAVIAEPVPDGADPVVLRVLAEQAEAARAAAAAAMDGARSRLLRAAQNELRPGAGVATAYAEPHERPGARFIDRTG